MVKPTMVLAAALSVSALALMAAQTPPGPARVSTKSAVLTTMDYIEIQQLGRRFVWALDGGDNFGYAYADLFTPDGAFVDATDGPNGKATQGRDNLALLARGGQRGPLYLNHFGMNHVITPSADGATGKAYVAILDLATRPHSVTGGGYYDDVYEKTAMGWRFKKRTFHPSKVDIWPAQAAPAR